MKELAVLERVPAENELAPRVKELAQREANGLSVTLYWVEGTGKLSVSVYDVRDDKSFEIPAQPENCLDVYNHPFAYEALRGSFVGKLAEFPQAA